MILQYGTLSRYFTLGELKFTVLSPDEPQRYGVVGDNETSVNFLAIPVESRRPCGPRSNLNLVKYVWDTYMFSFYKYITLILPSLGRVAYVKDPRAESDGWRSTACSLCRDFFEKLYKEWVECVHPSPSGCHCTVCFRRPMTLKGAASDVAFRYVLNVEAFTMDSRVPFDRFK